VLPEKVSQSAAAEAEDSVMLGVARYERAKVGRWERSVAQSALPAFDDLADGFFEADGDVPGGIVGAHLAEVAVVADVVAEAVFGDVSVNLFFAAEFCGEGEGFQYRAGVTFSAADIVNFTHAGGCEELFDEPADVEGMDVVADLFAHVAKNFVFAAFKVAFDEVTEEAVEFDAAVVGAGEAAAAEAAGGHGEVASVFLHHDIGGDFGGPEERVFGLIDSEGFGDAVLVGGVGVVPTGFKFAQWQMVGRIAVDFVGAQVHERGFGAGATGGFEKVYGADGVGVEVLKGDGGGAVVAGLGGSVNDGIGLEPGDEVEYALAVADVQFVVAEVLELRSETFLVPTGVALYPEEDSTLVIVHPVDPPAELVEVTADFAADEAGGAGDEEVH
jgi:hypothetical protein